MARLQLPSGPRLVVWLITGQKVRVTLRSEFPLRECLTRLERQVDSRGPVDRLMHPGGVVVTGWIQGSRVRLNPPREAFGMRTRNSWAPYLEGELIAYGRGTRLTGVFRVSRFVEVFMWCWLGLAAFLALSAALEGMGPAAGSGDELLRSAVTAVLFMAFGIALAGVGALVGSRDRNALLRFLDETCQLRADLPGALRAE